MRAPRPPKPRRCKIKRAAHRLGVPKGAVGVGRKGNAFYNQTNMNRARAVLAAHQKTHHHQHAQKTVTHHKHPKHGPHC